MKKGKIGVLFDNKCYAELIDALQAEIEELIKERSSKKTELQGLTSDLKSSMDKFSKKQEEIEQTKNNISDKKNQIKVFEKNVKGIKKAKIKLVKYNNSNNSKNENKFVKNIKGLTLNPPLDTTQPLVANFLNTENILTTSMLEEETQIGICSKELAAMEKTLEDLEAESKKIDGEIRSIDRKISKLKALLREIKRYLLLNVKKSNKLNSYVLKDKESISKEKFIPAREKVKQKELNKKNKKK